MTLNSDYEAKRSTGMVLGKPIVKSLPSGTFYNWLKSKGKLGGQNKVPRLTNDRTLADADGDFSDWIEVRNPTTAPVSLDGWHLTDSAAQLEKWTFPAVTLEAGGNLVVFASGKNRTVPGSELHTNFALDGDGEYLQLYTGSFEQRFFFEIVERRNYTGYGATNASVRLAAPSLEMMLLT